MKEGAENYGERAVRIVIDDPQIPTRDAAVLNSMKEELAAIERESNASRLVTICKVPQCIRQVNYSAYSSKMFSIGPYHHANQNLQSSHELKWRYLHGFLARNPEISLSNCIMQMRSSEERARSFYWKNMHMESDEFVEMMVLDGCFIVEILLKQMKEDKIDLKGTLDPIYRRQWLLPLIARDMLLLENQIPFFVLEQLYALVQKPYHPSLSDIAIDFFDRVIPKNDKIPAIKNIHHLLHLFHSRLLPDSKANKAKPQMLLRLNVSKQPDISILYKPPPPVFTIPTAAELQNLGIQFVVKEAAGSFLNVEFENGRMKIPRFSVHDNTESLFRNFIAFEQCFPEYGTHFTSFAIFMDSLVNTVNDVSILTHSGIMEQGLGSDKEIARLFNNLCKGIAFDSEGSYLNRVFAKVKDYATVTWHTWRASLMRDYFSNPWAILSLTGAFFVIVLTVIQTYFAVYAYCTSPS